MHRKTYEVLSVLLWNIIGIFGHTISAILTIFLAFFSGVYGKTLLSIYLTFMLFDIKSGDNASRSGRPLWFRNFIVWHHVANYFPIKLIKTVDLPASKNYLLAAYPHGMMAFGWVTSFGNKVTNFEQLFPGIRAKLCTLPIFLYIPFFREVFLSSHLMSVNNESVKKFLTEKTPRFGYKANAAVITVGGARESLHSTPGRYKIIIKSRKGFVRLALETGASLVPVFSFGEVDQFDLPLKNEKLTSSMFVYLPKTILRFLKIGLTQIMPKRTPINTVVGAPIDVEKVSKPSQTEIDELHKKFMKELEKLFDEHKKKFLENHQEIKLEMV